MSTSLAKQLKKLQIPGQFTSIEKESILKPSFLFTTKEAANLDIDTIYSLGINGLEELTSIQPLFAEFADSLFAESSKQFERTVVSADVINKVNADITKFLRLLSPYFLLRPAHKCIEWLIRGYKIHQCNIDVLMECVLPYYETKLFVRIIQLLPIDDSTSSWHWLCPVKKEGTPLSQLTLVQHCITDSSFLTFVCKMVLSSLSVLSDVAESSVRTMVAFYCTTVAEVIERATITSQLVTNLLPFVLKGFKSSNVDYRASAYMIISLLSCRVTFDGKLTYSLMESIIKHFGPNLKEEAVYCLITLSVFAESTVELTDKVLRHVLSHWDVLISVLETVSNQCDASAFLKLLLKALVCKYFNTNEESERRHLGYGILVIIQQFQLETPVVSLAVKCFVDGCVCHSKVLDAKSPYILEIFQCIDNKYPIVLDSILKGIQNDSNVNKKTLKTLQKLVTSALPGSRHEFSASTGGSLVLTLHHPDSCIRVTAVEHLGSILSNEYIHGTHEEDFISNALLARLNDESPNVIIATLTLGPEILLKYCNDRTKLLQSLMKILTNKTSLNGSKDWQSVVISAASVATSKSFVEAFSDQLDNIVTSLLSLFFITHSNHRQRCQLLQKIISSELSSHHLLFVDLQTLTSMQEWSILSSSSFDSKLSVMCVIYAVTSIAKQLVAMDADRLLKMVQTLSNSIENLHINDFCNNFHPFIVISVLGIAMEIKDHNYHLQLAVPLVKYLRAHVHHLNTLLNPLTLEHVLVPLMGKHLTSDTFQSSLTGLLLWLMEQLIENTPSPHDLSQSLWLHPPVIEDESAVTNDSLYYFVVLVLFDILSKHSEGSSDIAKTSQRLLIKIFKVHFPGRGALLRFLAMIWTLPGSSMCCGLCETTQIRALNIGQAYIRALDNESAVSLLSNYCPVFSSLLFPLASPIMSLRTEAFRCLQYLFQNASLSNDISEIYAATPLFYLLEYLVKREVELLADCFGLKMAFGRMFDDKHNVTFAKPVQELTSSRRKSRKKVETQAKEAILESIVRSLLLVIIGMDTPPSFMQSQLLIILSEVDHKSKLLGFLHMLKQLVKKVKEHNEDQVYFNSKSVYPLSFDDAHVLQLIISCFTPTIATCLDTEIELYESFLSLFTCSKPLNPQIPSPAELILTQVITQYFILPHCDKINWQITPDFYDNLNSTDQQQQVLQCIVDLFTLSTSSAVTNTNKQCLKQLPLRTEMIITELMRQEDLLKPNDATFIKKRKKQPNTSPDLLSTPWRRVTAMLEVIQLCSDDENYHKLLQLLFNLLLWCFEIKEMDKESHKDSLEYTLQILLSSLLKICTALSEKGLKYTQILSETQFDVDLIVRCLRHSNNPHTHHTCLLLLSTSAKIFPTRVLHNLMPVFSFMGSNLLQHDDAYTFDVINKTLKTIIPILIVELKNSTRQNKVFEILRVFIDAIPHIPSHRQLPLLFHLIDTVGSIDYLYVALGLLLEKLVVQSLSNEMSQGPKDSVLQIHLVVSLCSQFTADNQLTSISKLIEYIRQLPQQKPEPHELRRLSPNVSSIFSVARYSTKQLNQFRYTSFSFMIFVLGKMKRETNLVDSIEKNNLITNILQHCLMYLSTLNKYKGASSNDFSKVWDALSNKVNEVIDEVLSLLSTKNLLSVLLQLLSNEETQHKAITILIRKLEDPQLTTDNEQELMLLKFADAFINISPTTTPTTSTTHQKALYCLKLIISKLGSRYIEVFIDVMKSLIGLLKRKEYLNLVVHANILYCISELCQNLSAHAIPLLPDVVPCVLKCINKKNNNNLLQLSAVKTLKVIINTLPRFVSSFVETIVIKVCQADLIVSDSEDTVNLIDEANQLRISLAAGVPFRVLLPAIYNAIPIILDYGKVSIIALVRILKNCISGLKKQAVNQILLVDAFKILLEYRISKDHMSDEDVFEVEEEINNAFCELVIKLSESSFRPVIIELLDWATQSEDDRLITFYHLMRSIAKKLQSLFVLFAHHLTDNIVLLLRSCHSLSKALPFKDSSYADSLSKTLTCLELIFDTLQICFIHDKGNFLSKETFNMLMEPLIDQVTNNLFDKQRFQKLVESHLIPCISQFALAAGKEKHWKLLNHHLLMKTRNCNSQVRLFSVCIAEAVYAKLGDKISVLLPEMIPFLSELMEDESEEVEKQTQTTLATIEKILGESVQQYF